MRKFLYNSVPIIGLILIMCAFLGLGYYSKVHHGKRIVSTNCKLMSDEGTKGYVYLCENDILVVYAPK